VKEIPAEIYIFVAPEPTPPKYTKYASYKFCQDMGYSEQWLVKIYKSHQNEDIPIKMLLDTLHKLQDNCDTGKKR